MYKTLLKLNFDVKKSFKLSICLVFMTGIIYGIWEENPAHNLNAAFKSLRIAKSLSSSCENVSSDCQNNHTSYVKAVKKCFYISSVKHKITNIPAILEEITSYANYTDIVNEKYTTNHRNKVHNSHTACNRFITIGAYMGRFGNQMFEIASLLGIAYKYDIIPLIPSNYPITKYFDLPNKVDPNLNKLSNVVKCSERKSAIYYNFTEKMKTGKNISLHGYLQSWKYFSHAHDVIKTSFKFKQTYLDNARDFLSRVTQEGYKRVCIHVRRGDLMSPTKLKAGYDNGGLDFIEKARTFFREKYLKVQFIVISDDSKWCRLHIKGVNISTLTNPIEDLALMSLCDNVVFSTSTFGWWGAWLSGGKAVYFDKFPRPGSQVASYNSKDDFYPPHWMGIS